MEDTRAIAHVIARQVRLMVDNPDMVHLEAIPSATGVLYRISVAPDDVGIISSGCHPSKLKEAGET
jgi:predicted RNA-binding protein YlqC (UPF0109 family)